MIIKPVRFVIRLIKCFQLELHVCGGAALVLMLLVSLSVFLSAMLCCFSPVVEMEGDMAAALCQRKGSFNI